MKKEITVSIKFTEEELDNFIGNHVIDLLENQDFEVMETYKALGEFNFRIFTKENKEDKEPECITQNQCNMDTKDQN